MLMNLLYVNLKPVLSPTRQVHLSQKLVGANDTLLEGVNDPLPEGVNDPLLEGINDPLFEGVNDPLLEGANDTLLEGVWQGSAPPISHHL